MSDPILTAKGIVAALLTDRDTALCVARAVHALVAAEMFRRVCPRCGADFDARDHRTNRRYCKDKCCSDARDAAAWERRRRVAQPLAAEGGR